MCEEVFAISLEGTVQSFPYSASVSGLEQDSGVLPSVYLDGLKLELTTDYTISWSGATPTVTLSSGRTYYVGSKVSLKFGLKGAASGGSHDGSSFSTTYSTYTAFPNAQGLTLSVSGSDALIASGDAAALAAAMSAENSYNWVMLESGTGQTEAEAYDEISFGQPSSGSFTVSGSSVVLPWAGSQATSKGWTSIDLYIKAS